MLLKSEFFKEQKEYQTSRLNLRKFKLDDEVAMYKYTSNPNVAKYCSWPVYQNSQEAKNYIAFILDCYEKKIAAPWAIEVIETGEMIGSIDFVSWSDAHQNVEVGYVIAEEYWGKGYVTEALDKVIQLAFEEIGVHRLAAKCCSVNPASASVMKKNGLIFEGTTRADFYKNGQFYDMDHYSILSHEYFEKV